MQQTAMSWLVYRLTNSTVMLGIIGFTAQAPALLLAPFAGIIADRTNRHRLVMITQIAAMVQAVLLAAVVWNGHTHLWQLIVLSALLGAIAAFDVPTRQSFLVDMLDEDSAQLGGAIALSSSTSTLTRLIGPFLAGLLVSCIGEGSCFLLNALSYMAVIIALLFIKSKQRMKNSAPKSALSDLKEGFSYALGCTPIRNQLVLLMLVGLLVIPFGILMPAFAKDVFRGNAMTLGWLSGASAFGAMLGALFLTSKKGTQALNRWIVIGYWISGLSLIAFGASTQLPLSLLLVTLSGFGSMIVMTASITVIQTIVDEDKRGRVMSFVIMAVMGLSPLGFMAAGALAHAIGAGSTVIADGILIAISALLFGSRIRPIQMQSATGTVCEAIEEAEAELPA